MKPFYVYLGLGTLQGVVGAIELAVLVSGDTMSSTWAVIDGLVVFAMFSLFGMNLTLAMQEVDK